MKMPIGLFLLFLATISGADAQPKATSTPVFSSNCANSLNNCAQRIPEGSRS